jgi:aryl-alcohol dehydrogenase-like predicted oxidoreductase
VDLMTGGSAIAAPHVRAARVGLGCSTFVTKSRGVPEAEALKILDEAYSAGVRFFDTAHMYAGGRSEELLGEVLGDHRDSVTILTKGGVDMGDPQDLSTMRFDASLPTLRRHLEVSLARLRTDHVDIFLLHQFDPSRPVEEQMQSLATLRDEGLASRVGISNFPIDACRAAFATGVPSVVEYSYSLIDDRNVAALDVAHAADAHRIAFGVFAHGLLAEDLDEHTVFRPDDWRQRSLTTGDAATSGNALFAGDAYPRHLRVAHGLRTLAAARGLSLGTFVLATSLAIGNADRYLIGCRSASELRESLAAVDQELSEAELDAAKQVLTGDSRAGHATGPVEA